MGNLTSILTRMVGVDRERNNQIMFVSYYLYKFLKLYLSQTKKNVSLKKFATFIGIDRPVLQSPFNKLTGFKTCNFIKKRLQHRCFPVKVVKFFIEICEQLLVPFLLLTIDIFSWGLFLLLIQQALFKGPIQGLKGSPQGTQWYAPFLFEKKKEKIAEIVTHCH